MPAISLDDYGKDSALPKKKSGTSGTKVKAKSTAKRAKVVSSVKIKKKKKSTKFDPDSLKLDPEKLYGEAAEEGRKAVAKKEKKEKKEKKKKKSVPAVISTADMEMQAQEFIEAIPDIVRQENEQIEEYIRMFDQLKLIVRKAENRYLESGQGRDLYPLMQVYNQMRELIADLRALRDVGQLGEVISSEVVSPFAQLGGNTMVKMTQEINAWIKSNVDDLSVIENSKEAIDGILRRAAKDFQISYEAALAKTVEVFG